MRPLVSGRAKRDLRLHHASKRGQTLAQKSAGEAKASPALFQGSFQPLTQRPPTVCIPTAHLAAFRRAAVRMQVPLTM
jgi:hypothetical protein